MANLSNRMLLISQTVIGVVALGGMSVYPPAQGRILLIPVFDRQADAAAQLALSAGAALLGRGPLPGSWIVMGQRDRIATRTHSWDMLLLAAPPGGCGDDSHAVTV
ncbi:hypothetical protein [Sphingomonas endophytica]|uniref:hypothetical protein n=1 Tax=Sphingomonas endophytica TaxID=869719 RepID=UPI000736F3DE|nr:hypothetical protein [Sphingomonas endophytica]